MTVVRHRALSNNISRLIYSVYHFEHNNTPFNDCVKRSLRRFKIVYFTLHYITLQFPSPSKGQQQNFNMLVSFRRALPKNTHFPYYVLYFRIRVSVNFGDSCANELVADCVTQMQLQVLEYPFGGI